MTLLEAELARTVLHGALRRGGDVAEVYVEARHGFALGLDDRRVERPQAGDEVGASVRLISGDAAYFGHVDGLREDDLLRVARSVADARAADDAGARREGVEVRSAKPEGTRHPVEIAPQQVDAARKADLLRICDATARGAGDEVAQVSAAYVEERRVVEVFNSDGMVAADDRTRVRLAVQVVARRGDVVETGSETHGGHAGYELLGEGVPEEVAGEATRKALTMLDAVPAPSGPMPIVVGNAFGGVLLHEAVGHGLEADVIQKDASVYTGKLGERVAPEFVTAYDDGSRTGAWGSDGIDDEGTPTQRTTIIEDGRLTSYMYDFTRARRDGVAPTGNGRRESFRHLPIPRMTNTFFAPGEATPEELISDTARGLYAVSFGGGQVDPATGDFVFGVSEGYLIEDGHVTSPVRGATVIGNGLEALLAIDGIAGDLDIGTGYCGKSGQRVPAGVGQPHVRLMSLTVGGTGE